MPCFEVEEPDELDADQNPLPQYGVPGRMLIHILAIDPNPDCDYAYELEVLDYDADTSIFWANEGVGFDWLLECALDVEIELPGYYVLEGVVGHYHKGEWGFTDDDEEWDFALCRRASPEEIVSGQLTDERPG